MKTYFLLTGFLLTTLVLFSQGDSIRLPFLTSTPVIDGLPGPETTWIDWKTFPFVKKSEESNPDISLRYQLAYAADFLYVLIECQADSIIHRDRAYQNGDGFHLLIAKPDEAGTADEFYVLRFSPEDAARNKPARKAQWYYNIGLSSKQLSEQTLFSTASEGGKSYFELLLPWKEVVPFHPFYQEPAGLNLCFVKAVGSMAKNLYFLKYDRRMQSELSRREYLPVDFEQAGRKVGEYESLRLRRRNIRQGEGIPVEIIAHRPGQDETGVVVEIVRNDSALCQIRKTAIPLIPGWNRIPMEIPAASLVPGNYSFRWKFGSGRGDESSFTVLPVIDFISDSIALEKLSGRIKKGDYYTLRFILHERSLELATLKEYETASQLLRLCQKYNKSVQVAGEDVQALTTQPGVQRRAFRSAMDGSLQPYSIRLPEPFDPSRKYPLFVILHGSGSDDRDMLGKSLTGNQCIELAPYGRGTSNCFAADGAVEDVREAIEDAILNYPVDTGRIILSGFSMGGYGAYRIFSEYPGLFKAIAVFSGHPSLASRWLGEGYPDYLEESRLKVFQEVPLFIYHSRNDMNCPFSLTEELCNKLRMMGADLDFVIAEESGHGLIDKEHQQDYDRWLSKILLN